MSRGLCGRCALLKTALTESYTCSKRARFCDQTDIRLLELIHEARMAPVSLNEIEVAKEAIMNNAVRLGHRIATGSIAWPEAPEEFLGLLLNLNRSLFASIPCPKLGRFREGNETVFVDSGSHQFEGCKAQDLEKSLSGLWDEFSRKIQNSRQITRKEIAGFSAYFLVTFFAIHPFHDGNGRTARFFLRIFSRRHGFDLNFNTTTKAVEKKYVEGLRAAHRDRIERGVALSNGYSSLQALLDSFILGLDSGEEEIQPSHSERS